MLNRNEREMIDDRVDQSNGEDCTDSSMSMSMSSTSGGVETSAVGSREIGLTERLTEVFVEEGDGDLLLQRSDREDRVLQWLLALDMQVMGACRADERLKPLLKSNAFSGVAEDRLLAHLSQYFEPSEVCMLARCFCIPLVSIRVGKIDKQGPLLCPTAIRGNLSLSVLPTSDLRLSFIGDDGQTERLFTFSSKIQCSAIVIEKIQADNSGRSFLVKIPDDRVLYFWCSEKAKLLGIELISKMNDLIKRKPSIAELTGISESRLGYLANHLRAYLVGSSLSNTRATAASSPTPYSDTTFNPSDSTQSAQCSSASSRSQRSRQSGSLATKANSLYQCSLSPRSSSFKEGLARNLSLKNTAREKLRRRGDGYLSAVDNLIVASPVTSDESCSIPEISNHPEVKNCQFSPSFLESLGKLAVPPTLSPATQASSIGSPIFSPYYCWCPITAASMQYPSETSQLPTSSSELPLLPPLSSLLAGNGSSGLLTPTSSLSLADIPSLDFPEFLPDPLVRLQLPSSQQIPTFTPLMCDPIVHIPVINVCSAGQGYLVSAGPAISTTIPPLHSKLVNPLIPEGDSLVEKNARETLRVLISSSSQSNPPLMNVLPAVLTSADEKQSIFVAGSRGLYSGTRDVDTIGNSIAFLSLSSSSTFGNTVIMGCNSLDKLDPSPDDSNVLSEYCFSNDDNAHFSNSKEERTD
ncbi:hypothetical protein LWI28_011347 [Acer negundo]|uniref:RNI-like superfamily protein n=1 Tax=Acer negundo TaxID=4023 RepID=A0AAD5NFJ2_ACENE|nr:hypothetical protein LWI28_011347 [Acer negundo]KAK4835499.1 hypothetical protein QYF36_010505 [Acer negundo]